MYDRDNLCIESLNELRLKNNEKIRSLYGDIDLSYNYEFIGDVFKTSKNFLSQSLQSIGSWFATLRNSTPDPLPHFNKIEKDVNIITKFCKNPDNYLKYGGDSLSYMAGCSLNIKEFGELLCGVDRNHIQVVEGMIDDCVNFLSNVISNENFRVSAAPVTLTPNMKNGIKFIESIDRLHAKLIDPNNKQDKILLSNMCNNLAELNDVSNSIYQLQKTLNFKAFENLSININGASDLSCFLSREISSGQMQCSKAIIEGIKQYLGTCANAVTALSTYYYFVSQYALIYKSCSAHVEKL